MLKVDFWMLADFFQMRSSAADVVGDLAHARFLRGLYSDLVTHIERLSTTEQRSTKNKEDKTTMITKEKLEDAFKKVELIFQDESDLISCPFCSSDNVALTDVAKLTSHEAYKLKHMNNTFYAPFSGGAVALAFLCDYGCEFLEIKAFHKGKTYSMYIPVDGSGRDEITDEKVETALGQSKLFDTFEAGA